jgi:ribonuclease J
MDTSRTGFVDDRVLRERQQLAEDGVVTVAVAIDSAGRLVVAPQINLRGVVTAMDPKRLQTKVEDTIEATLRDRWKEFIHTYGNGQTDIDWEGVRAQLEGELRRALRRELQSNPMLIVLLQAVDAPEEPVKSAGRGRRTAAIAS